MKLIRLELTDFGVYQGKVTFDLNSGAKPIVLFGGKNGSGKTTILEAIKLCLYGPKAFGLKTNKQAYEEHIRNRVHRHRGAVVPLNYTEIRLVFEYSINGNERVYEVIRSWRVRGKSIQETLVVYVDGKLLTGIPQDKWQDYIEDLVPSRITELFFFDGEKIQDLVIDNFNEYAFAAEVKKLLGINNLERIYADLDTYLYKQKKQNLSVDLQKRLEKAEVLYTSIDQEYQKKLRESVELQTKIDYVLGQVEKLERQLNLESSGYALQREDLKEQLSRTEIEIEFIEKQLFELSSGLLPFALIPELNRSLKTQLLLEGKIHQLNASKKMIEPKINSVIAQVKSEEYWSSVNYSLPLEIRGEFIKQFTSLLESIIPSSENDSTVKVFHQISEYERNQILSWIIDSNQTIPKTARDIGQRLSILENTRQEILAKLQSIPDDEFLRPIIEKINILNEELNDLNQKLSRANLERDQKYNERENAEREKQKSFDNLKMGKRIEDRITMIGKTQSVINRFLLEVIKRKITILEALVVGKFNLLSRKPDIFKYISIDPQSFSIQLFDFDDKPIPKNLLSAGEKQMLAISLLWALRELSGKPFPVIIDTPLGRLDSEHRENLIKKYFPKVSHQVILFSTDTEIDQEYFKALEPEVSHTFLLDYDSIKGRTNTSSGYFWNEVDSAA